MIDYDNIDLLEIFYKQNPEYQKTFGPIAYGYYLKSIIPNGKVIQQGNNFYIVHKDDVYKCGSDKNEIEKFKNWWEEYYKQQEDGLGFSECCFPF